MNSGMDAPPYEELGSAPLGLNRSCTAYCERTKNCGVAEWLKHSVSNLVGSISVGSNPIVGTTNN